MFNNTAPVVALIAAFAGTSAHAAATDSHGLPRSIEMQAARTLRAAQVQLYCDHREDALLLIQRARHELLAAHTDTPAAALGEIDQALWYIRRDDTGAAVARLDAARGQLKA